MAFFEFIGYLVSVRNFMSYYRSLIVLDRKLSTKIIFVDSKNNLNSLASSREIYYNINIIYYYYAEVFFIIRERD